MNRRRNRSSLRKQLDVTLFRSPTRKSGTGGQPHSKKVGPAVFFVFEYGEEFLRIESISKVGDSLRTLDLKQGSVRDAVRAFEGGKVTALYESDAARVYQ